MRCYICDVVIHDPVFDKSYDGAEPCGECKAVIADAVGAFRDKAAADEDDFFDEVSDYLTTMMGELK